MITKNPKFLVLCSAVYSKYEHRAAQAFFFGSHIVSAIYTLYWDLVNDWGLLNWNSKNFLLRNELIYGHGTKNWIYYLAIIEDIILRFAWLAHYFLKANVLKTSLGSRIQIKSMLVDQACVINGCVVVNECFKIMADNQLVIKIWFITIECWDKPFILL